MPATKFDKPVFPGAKLVETTVTVSNTSGSYSNTFTDERVATSMRAFQIEIEDPSIFNDKITITTANGSFTLACDEVAGETDVTIGFLKIADDPTEVTSTEFTVLNNRIGDLSSLTTTAKTSAVAAINENKQAIANINDKITTDTQSGTGWSLKRTANAITLYLGIGGWCAIGNVSISSEDRPPYPVFAQMRCNNNGVESYALVQLSTSGVLSRTDGTGLWGVIGSMSWVV